MGTGHRRGRIRLLWILALGAVCAVASPAMLRSTALMPTRATVEGEAAATGGANALATPDLASVTVVRVEKRALDMAVTVSGTVVPREEIIVGAEIDGLAIREVLVEEGDRVEKGQLLARLSSDVATAALAINATQIERAHAMVAQAASAIEEAEAGQALAISAFGRARPLTKSGAASQNMLEQREADAAMANARLNAARQSRRLALAELQLGQAQRRELEVKLLRTEIRAPVAGIVLQRIARRGAIASGQTPLFRLIRDGQLDLEAQVPMASLGRMDLKLRTEILLPGHSAPFGGEIRRLSPSVDATSRMGTVRIGLHASHPARVGIYARARVLVENPVTLTVPLTAVLSDGTGVYVQVVRDTVVESRPVTLGAYSASEVQILHGLAEGEEVVRTAGSLARVGSRVRSVLPSEVVASAE